jgi:CheY-like chemotaxis protein
MLPIHAFRQQILDAVGSTVTIVTGRRSFARKMRVLVVDDSPWNRSELALERLGKMATELTVIETVSEAFNLFREAGRRGLPVDVVLTDLMMPWDAAGRSAAYNPRLAHPEDVADSAGLIPAGLAFAAAAVNCGKRAAICSDADQHRSRLVEVLDLLDWWPAGRPIVKIEARTVAAPLRWSVAHGQFVRAKERHREVEDPSAEDGYRTVTTIECSDPTSGSALGEVAPSEVRYVKDWGRVLHLLLHGEHP